MRKTVRSDEESPEKKKFRLSVYWEKFQGQSRNKSPQLQVRYYIFFPNTSKVMWQKYVSAGASSQMCLCTSCRARRDSFTTSWPADKGCHPYEMFMMWVSTDLPGAMRLRLIVTAHIMSKVAFPLLAFLRRFHAFMSALIFSITAGCKQTDRVFWDIWYYHYLILLKVSVDGTVYIDMTERVFFYFNYCENVQILSLLVHTYINSDVRYVNHTYLV